MGPREAFARAFERFFLFIGRHGDCRVERRPDTFDGVAYAPDEFAAFVRPALSAPDTFFSVRGAQPDMFETDAPRRAPYRAFAFDAPYRSGYVENDTARFKWFTAETATKDVVLFAPGWPRPDQALEESICRRLRAGGVDAALAMVPFSQARTPAGAYSGEYFISANALWTVENFRAFVAELRLLTRWLQDRYERVYVLGFSSGGIPAAIAAGCEHVAGYLPVMTAADPAGLMWASSITGVIRAQLAARGIDRRALEAYWSIIDPARLPQLAATCRVRQYLTRFDAIVPPACQRELWHALGEPPLRELPTSHFGIVFFIDALARDACAFIRDREAGG